MNIAVITQPDSAFAGHEMQDVGGVNFPVVVPHHLDGESKPDQTCPPCRVERVGGEHLAGAFRQETSGRRMMRPGCHVVADGLAHGPQVLRAGDGKVRAYDVVG